MTLSHLVHSGVVVDGGVEAEHVAILTWNLKPAKDGKGAPKLFIELSMEKFCVSLKESESESSLDLV